jgi:nitrate reductase gamma subunit
VSWLVWGALPYAALASLVLGTLWRWRTDPACRTLPAGPLLDSRLLRLGVPLFHVAVALVLAGHVLGLLVPASWTAAVGLSAGAYQWLAVVAGGVAGTLACAGLVLLVARRAVTGRLRATTTRADLLLYAVLGAVLGSGTAIKAATAFGTGHEHRETVAVWFRSLLTLQPDVTAMSTVPVLSRAHVVLGLALVALLPYTRLVHAVTVPLGLLRPVRRGADPVSAAGRRAGARAGR